MCTLCTDVLTKARKNPGFTLRSMTLLVRTALLSAASLVRDNEEPGEIELSMVLTREEIPEVFLLKNLSMYAVQEDTPLSTLLNPMFIMGVIPLLLAAEYIADNDECSAVKISIAPELFKAKLTQPEDLRNFVTLEDCSDSWQD